MGKRKREMAERQKAIKKQTAVAKLNDVPTSPRKMRYSADLIRGVEVNKALDILKFTKKEAAQRLYKLLKSAIVNWESKNEADRKELDNGNVIVKTIMVSQGRTLKRIRPATQGRANRIRKRSNHVTIILDTKTAKAAKAEKPVKETKTAAPTVAEKPVKATTAKATKPAAKKTTAKKAPATKKAPAKKATVKAEEK